MSNQTQQIAETILEQLGGQRKLIAMTRAYHFMALEEGGITFKFKGSQKFNYCKILLTPLDTYTVIFEKWNWKAFSLHKEQSFDDIYYDALIPLFEKETGLYLSLFPVNN
ncbi:MAG: hypothetical protein AB4041_13285 [Microcystaceae cyanobacterium]